MTRPFRFGAQHYAAQTGAAWAAAARQCELLGFDVLTVPDHFGRPFAPWPALTAAAAATSTLRLSTLVLSVDFWHPAVIARDAATTDVLSEGRVELGMGAGWLNTDYATTGIRRDSPGLRVERLGEAVRAVKSILAGGHTSMQGSSYQLDEHPGIPRPHQAAIPLFVGGGGRRVLSLAAAEADIVGINLGLAAGTLAAAEGPTAAAVQRRVGWVQEAAGDRFSDLELHVFVLEVVVTSQRRAAAAEIGARLSLTADEVLTSPYVLVGTHEQMADDLLARREAFGLSYLVVRDDAMTDLAPVIGLLR